MKQTSNPRLIVSGRLKKLSKQFPVTSVANSNIKKPFLKQYSLAMQDKLLNLKQKIQQKRKQKQKQKNKNQVKNTLPNLQKILSSTNKQKSKINNLIKTFIKNQPQQQHQCQQPNNEQKKQLIQFLKQSNMQCYQQILFKNQIDTLEILKQATNKQLQEIGLAKGHVLKIKIILQKYLGKKDKLISQVNDNNRNNQYKQKQDSKFNRQSKTKDSQRLKQSQLIEHNNKQTKHTQSISIGTGDQNNLISHINNNKNMSHYEYKTNYNNKFCLFCYQSIKINLGSQLQNNICSQQCQQHYNLMFKKYQTNLIKAQIQFKSQQNPNQSKLITNLNQQQQQNQNQNQDEQQMFDLMNLDVLDVNDFDQFDMEEYENVKRKIL